MSGDGHRYLVYQMGKVGSSSVCESLRRAGVEPLFKVHYLSDGGLERARQLYAGFHLEVGVPHEATSVAVREQLRSQPDVQWKVVTLVREPIARDVSAYIQMVDLLNPELVGTAAPDVARIARAAAAQFIGFDEIRSYVCRWFDEEFRTVLGIDVFAQPFDHERGWLRMRHRNIDVLLLRLEDLDRTLEVALGSFTGNKVSRVHASSRSADKLQAAYVEDVYKEIVARLRIPADVCRKVYASRYATHFYRSDEIDRFVDRWTTGTA